MIKKLYLAGEWRESKVILPVVNPYDDSLITEIYEADEALMEEAISKSVSGFRLTKNLTPGQRAECLDKVITGLKERKEEFGKTIAMEAGKPITYALGEVDRAILTFTLSRNAALETPGEYLDLALQERARGYQGFVKKVPIGPVAAISPFNFPLNLVAHKVGPAMAAGCSIVLKPASKTPLTALLLAELVEASGWPKEGFSVVPCKREVGQKMVEDERFKLLSFTGSPVVGWKMKEKAGKKRVVLELGGNAGVYVDKTANIDDTVSKCSVAAFAYAGQVCISVQRILVHEDIFDEFKTKFIEETKKAVCGDQMDEKTVVGPMIDKDNVARITNWLEDARQAGAIVHGGEVLDHSIVKPAVVEKASNDLKVNCVEAFGPLVTIAPVKDIKQACEILNDSDYGLQAGIFTTNIQDSLYAFDELEVGGVLINETPLFRMDNMPYGGVKDSGFGREGVRYAMEDMTERRICILRRDI